jgi:hypothetical protein
LRHVEMGTAGDGVVPAVRSTTESLAARVWELLDHTQTVSEIVARLRAGATSSGRDSYALECAVASAVEQCIAVGRVRLVRRDAGGEVLVRPACPTVADG